MTEYERLERRLMSERRNWLVTGVAGFIGSNLLEALLKLNQNVIGLDNLSTGQRRNLDEVKEGVTREQWRGFSFIEGDIRSLSDAGAACAGAEFVLHQAALGSVPRSFADPISTNAVNIDGFVNVIVSARAAGVKRFVYASSSSVYGDETRLPNREDRIGKPLSPYAVTKYANELYAGVFGRSQGLECVGLRYFNVFGPRQNPSGEYAAVIPLWFSNLIGGKTVYINGDGETTRDFCFVGNAVQANILAALAEKPEAVNQVFNVAHGESTSLNALYAAIRDLVNGTRTGGAAAEPVHRDFRIGDMRHSLADISKARSLLAYAPRLDVGAGLARSAPWYLERLAGQPSGPQPHR